ncbi:ABC transporter permease [Xylophilus sp. GW821-FHT01B05]
MKWRQRFDALLPVLGIAGFIAAWAVLVRLGQIDASVLPGPLDVLRALHVGLFQGALWGDALFTLAASLAGLAIGCGLGLAGGIWIGDSATAHRFLYPVAMGVQAMPMVALAPLLIAIFGLGAESKIAMVAISCTAPVFVGTVAGMGAANPDLLSLYRVCGAGRWRTLVDVKLPGALDYIFGGLQVAVALAFVSCVVAEFIASERGLGHLIKSLSSQLDMSAMFAAIAMLAIMGGGCGALLRVLHRRVVHWAQPHD